VDEHHKTKKSVQDLAAEELQLINSGQHSPESVTTLGDFIERVYLPNVKATKRPSTYKGYQDLYQYHIEKRCASVWLRDVRTCDVQKWLHTFAGEDKNGAGEPICKTTLKHIKHFLGGVFRYAQQLDFFDSARPNPVHAASIPAHAPDGKEGQPYMPEEVERMLEVLLEPAATIVAVAAWTGLRRGEIRGMTWEAYSLAEDSESLGLLNVTRSVWEKYVTAPKRPKSAAPVPVIPQLAEKLAAHRKMCGNPFSGPMFANSLGKPLDLESLYRREMKEALLHSGVQWRGWHAFRRGLASYLNRLGVDDSVTAWRRSSSKLTLAR